MNVERYRIFANDDFDTFGFFSEGPKGKVRKVVVFEWMDKNYYNLSFGDLDEQNVLRDNVRTNNDDRNKILVTIADIIQLFLKVYPEAEIQFQGITPARTRLYQAAIKKFLPVFSAKFEIAGLKNGSKETFQLDKNYDRLFIRLKK